MKENLFIRKFKRTTSAHQEYFDSQRIIGYFENALRKQLFDLGTKPLFKYYMKPGEELRQALSEFLAGFHENNSSFSGIKLAKDCLVEVRGGEKIKVFISFEGRASREVEKAAIEARKRLEASNTSMNLVYSRLNNKIGIFCAKTPEKKSDNGKVKSAREEVFGGADV